MNALKQFFTAPVFPDQPDKTLKAKQVNIINNWGILSLLAFALLTLFDHSGNLLLNEALLLLAIVILFGIQQLIKNGRVQLACWLFPLLASIGLNISVIRTGGVSAAGFGANMIIIILVGILNNLGAALGYTIIISLFGLGMVAAQSAGFLPAQTQITPVSIWIFITICFLFTAGILQVAINSLRAALSDVRRELAERQKTEKALRESEERFSILSIATSEGIGITDQDKIVDANPQLASMMGYKPGELIGLNANDFVAPESRNLVNAHEMAEFEGLYEHLAIRKDGTVFPVEIRARTIPFKGKHTRVAIIHDITERKQFEKNLSQQIERLRALHTIEQAVTSSMNLHTILELLVKQIVEQLQVDATSVLLLNPQKKTLDFAAGQGFHTKALQYTSLEIGKGLAGRAALERQIVHIANLSDLENNPVLAHSLKDEKFVSYFGVPLIAKDQLRGVLEIFHRSALAPDPNWLRFLETLAGQAAISIDNARLLEMTMESLKESNALYRINQDIAATMDPAQLMEDVVNLLQASFGYYYVQIFVIQPETGDFVFRTGSGKIGEQLKSQGYRLAAGEGIVGLTAATEKPFFTNNVDEVISFVRAPFLMETKSELAVPLKAGDRFLGLLDIHQAPPAILTELDVQLVSAVADQLAVALQKAQLYADLQNSLLQEQATRSQLIHTEKLATAGRLLASVSHELNNPLQAIQNALFLLKDEKGVSEQGQQDLKIVLSEAERMATLLERLRTTYQPIDAEDFQPVQINDIIEDVHALVATHLRHASISFELHTDPDLPAIPGLANQLKQVILNLFMNSVDAMPVGGRLIASTACLPEHREILITVTDTGMGIDESILPNLFEAFITNKEKGTGLGLAISYEIVQKHRGRIRAENRPEGGATFNIWLPVENGATK